MCLPTSRRHHDAWVGAQHFPGSTSCWRVQDLSWAGLHIERVLQDRAAGCNLERGPTGGAHDNNLLGPRSPAQHHPREVDNWGQDNPPCLGLYKPTPTHKAGMVTSDTGLSFCHPRGKKIQYRDGSRVCRELYFLHTESMGWDLSPFYIQVQARSCRRFYLGFGTQRHQVMELR